MSAIPRPIKLRPLLGLSLDYPKRVIRRWWLARMEEHYLVCADVEAARVREAQANQAYYQRKAATARSDRNSL